MGWQSWSTVSHSGTNGTNVGYNRLFYAPANVADTTVVDLYLSVTANRVIIFVQGPSSYQNWAYFGGLDALAGVSDPNCVVLTGSGSSGYASYSGVVLAGAAGGPWESMVPILPIGVQAGIWDNEIRLLSTFQLTMSCLTGSGAVVGWPVMMADSDNNNNTHQCLNLRGNLDGVLYVPLYGGGCGHLDTVSIGGITYLAIQPGGAATTGQYPAHAITGNYGQGLLLAEV
jgi:hypothetical protein